MLKKTQSRIEERVVEEALYIIKNQSTIRATAKVFYISKSTVYVDMSKRLKLTSLDLYTQVKVVLQKNKAERAYRGGIATRNKYLKLKKSI